MNQDSHMSRDQQPTSDPAHALEPRFTHDSVAEAYQQGLFCNRVDAELADLFTSLGVEVEEQPQEGTMPLTDEAIASLNCIAIIQGGRIIPCMDLEQMPKPTTAMQKMELCAMAARVVLDALIEILDHWDERASTWRYNDDEEGGPCYAKE